MQRQREQEQPEEEIDRKRKKINQPTKGLQGRSDLSCFRKTLDLWRKNVEGTFYKYLNSSLSLLMG